MSTFVPIGVITSRAQEEHGKRAVAACLHPRRRSAFIVAGQVVDEVDTRDGTLISRIISDLTEPIVRLEVSVGARGHEYLLLLSAANELRVWDIESRAHLAAVNLNSTGGAGADAGAAGAGAMIALFCASSFHERCILFFSRGGSPIVEALHLQRQIGAWCPRARCSTRECPTLTPSTRTLTLSPHANSTWIFRHARLSRAARSVGAEERVSACARNGVRCARVAPSRCGGFRRWNRLSVGGAFPRRARRRWIKNGGCRRKKGGGCGDPPFLWRNERRCNDVGRPRETHTSRLLCRGRSP